ncbi:uncharacterized protein LOC131329310 [Rhododendron vialii]|uniref:uncharacterized protein LOC131329310 n=1 Tax=Rhododendron vialii TaxID=182163 RepID=UPI00265FC0D0|nr:uncharacterized protein LOC131329310 [Rhododendron vialii]
MEAIDAIPQFAKVLKDLRTSKWRTKSQDKVLLTEQVSSILHADIPIKSNNHGCPTIPITITCQKFDKALLDLGASSVRVPKGVVEDVLIQVGEFLFSIDFIILNTCPIPKVFKKTPIILGRPFLATSNAIMNCKTGQVQMSFGDLKMEDPLEIALTTEEASFLDSPEVGSLMEMLAVEYVCGTAWDVVLELLGATLSKALPSSVQLPKVELKPLPDTLKYAFLKGDDTIPVVISSSLEADQEAKLFALLREHIGTIG